MSHAVIETRAGLLGILIAVVISVGGLVEIVPLYFSSQVTTPAPGVKPYTALQFEGRDIYIREGCYNCHSQMVRPLRAETERYGHYSLAGESVYDHPFQFGSKRTGPDLARVGVRGQAAQVVRIDGPASLGRRQGRRQRAMNATAGIIVTIAALVNIAAVMALLAGLRRRRGEASSTTETTAHVWDGDLRELNN